MEFVVRKTIIEDLEQLPALYKSGFGKDTNTQKMYEKFEKLKNDEHYLFYSAVTEENELVGFMNVILHEDIVEECKDFATVWNVRAKYKRQGIATKMFQVMEQELKARDVDFINLTAVNTDEANEFYKKLGYEQYVENKITIVKRSPHSKS